MKEDILEQLVEDWLVSEPGMFVKHNLKFRPDAEDREYSAKLDSVHSDVDILGFSGVRTGKEKVAVISCKSWQGGFSPGPWLRNIESEATYHERSAAFTARERWKYFRELVSPKWMRSLLALIQRETAQSDFTYYVAVTRLNGKPVNRAMFEASQIVRDRFAALGSDMDLKIITLEEIIDQYLKRIRDKETLALESTDVGRLLQLMEAAKIKLG